MDLNGLIEWQKRMDFLQDWDDLSTAKIKSISSTYNIDYLVTRKIPEKKSSEKYTEFPIAYENAEFVVYKVRS